MWDYLSKMHSDELIMLAMFVGFPILAILAFAVYLWHNRRLRESENALKLQLMAKGYSAADIERVVQASPGGENMDVQPEPKRDRADLVRILLKFEMEAGDIERLLHLFAEYPESHWPTTIAAVESLLVHGMEVDDIERVTRALHPLAGAAECGPQQ